LGLNEFGGWGGVSGMKGFFDSRHRAEKMFHICHSKYLNAFIVDYGYVCV